MNLKGKKILILGGVVMLKEMVEYCRSKGIYTIVADYSPDSPAKSIADEAWLISTIDTEALAKKCEEVGVNGVISGFDDFNISCCQKLSERIGTPFYATAEQILQTMDKKHFKQLCRDNGVPVTPEYDVSNGLTDEALRQIRYPVIIKPVDSSGARGITICHSREELEKAWQKAYGASKKGDVILEKYLSGDEIGVNYILSNGKIMLSAIHDRYLQRVNTSRVNLPVAYVYPSKHTEQYQKLENQKVIDMFRSIGMTDGTLFLQGFVEEGLCYFYEMGYRLNGAKQYNILETLCGFNPMHMLVNHSLTGQMTDLDIEKLADPRFPKCCCTLSVLARPGKIHKVVGLDEIRAFPETAAITEWYQPGETIENNALGTQKQIIVRITLITDTMRALADAINRVYAAYDAIDVDGESMLLDRFDTSLLFE